MERFLLDTNVLSELRKARPNQNVLNFFQQLTPTHAFISALSLGELREGVVLRAKRDLQAAQDLSAWIDGLEEDYNDRILPIEQHVSRIWGELSADRSRAIVDTLIAATAIHHRLTLVTRNVRDVQDTPVLLHNPWLEV